MELNNLSSSLFMIDYIMGVLNDPFLSKRLLGHDLLDFHREVNEKTSELNNYAIAAFKALKIKTYDSGRIELKGSLHKYWNDGLHNYDDFGINEIRQAISRLEQELGIDSNLMRIHNLEIGLNLKLPFKTKAVLDSMLAYNNKPFSCRKVNTPGTYVIAEKTQFFIKGYDKATQNELDYELMRYELHIKKMEYISSGPVYLSDLATVKFFEKMWEELITSFDNVIFSDKINIRALSSKELDLYRKCCNPFEWRDMTPKERCINKKAFEILIDNYGKHQYKRVLKEIMLNIYVELSKETELPEIVDIIAPKEYSDHLITMSEHLRDAPHELPHPSICVRLRTFISSTLKWGKTIFKLDKRQRNSLPTRLPKSRLKNPL